MKKQILACATVILIIATFTGCIGSGDDDLITDVTVCELENNHTSYIGEIVRTVGHFENADLTIQRWRLITLDPICEIAFDHDFSGSPPQMGELVTVIGFVQQDKVDVGSKDLVLLDDCYIES